MEDEVTYAFTAKQIVVTAALCSVVAIATYSLASLAYDWAAEGIRTIKAKKNLED